MTASKWFGFIHRLSITSEHDPRHRILRAIIREGCDPRDYKLHKYDHVPDKYLDRFSHYYVGYHDVEVWIAEKVSEKTVIHTMS